MPQDNISKLYGALKDTYELGSEDDFRKYLSDGNKREALRKELESEYDVGDSTSFTKYLGLDAQPKPVKPYNPSEDTMGAGVGAAVLQKPNQPQATQQKKPQQKSKGSYQPTWQEQWAAGITTNQAENAALNASLPIDQREANAKTYNQKVMGQNAELGRQGRVVEDNGSYITEDATRHNVMVDANKIQRDAEATYTAGLQQQLDSLYDERNRIQKEMDNTPKDWVDADGRVHTVSDADKEKYVSLMSDYKANEEALKELRNNPRLVKAREEEPGFLGVTGKKLGAGFMKAGLGLLNGMEALASGMIVEDASSPTGYSRAPEYNPSNPNDHVSAGLKSANEYAENMSRQGEVRGGRSFTDLLLDGDISGFLLKGWGTGLESAPMTLSAYNPYTMALNAISMAGNNFRDNTIQNPDIPTWKRAMMAIGSAAIEQAVEKYADPVFKYIGGGASKKVTQEIAEQATQTIAKRIVSVLKDAAGEGAEEVITNFGNDALGQALDWLDGESNYGIVAQWRELKKQNPNATLGDFALQKAKENVDSFFGGALAGAYMSGTAQATAAGLQYAVGNTVSPEQIEANPNTPLHPATLDIAQSFDRGFDLEKDEDKTAAADKYSAYRSRVEAAVGEETLNKIDANPTEALSNLDQYGLDEEGQRILGEYLSAKATFDGVQQRIVEDNRANRPNFVVNGNNIDEVDAQGNVINTHEYANEDEMKAGLWELQARRDYLDMQADVNMMRLNPKYDWDEFVDMYIVGTGLLSREGFDALLNKDPMERDENEDQFLSAFAKTLHETLYGNTEVHEEQSAQDGAKLADSMSIDINDLSEENAARAQQLTNELNSAQQALNEAFAKNEDLKQEVERMEQQGMPHQGIVASLDTFRPEEVQAVIDFYNANAKFEGFRNQMARKIDEEAANSTKRHTLKGTINGQADLGNIYTISDGTNEYYLVSGNITTDSAGRITGSDSGLIIGMDLDGSMVSIGDTSGYSLTPNVVSAAQFEEAERIRLQEEWTAKIDPTGSMMPQEQLAEQPIEQIEEQPVVEAGDTNVSGANEAAAAPSPVEIPVDEKSGLKRYEQGVPVEQAISDIQNDGFDVNEMADAYIAEAQEQIDKINGKKAKKPQDLIERKRLTDVITYYNNIKEQWAAQNQPEQPVVAEKPATPSIPSGLTVEEQKQERIRALKAELGELFDDDFTKANDVYELVSMWLSRDRKLSRDSVGQELGWNMGVGKDARYVETMLAKKGEGISINDFVHGVWESPENTVDGEKRFTTEEIKEALLDLFSSATSKSDVVDYALNTRENQARASLAQQQQFEEKAAEDAQNEQPAVEPINTDTQLPFGQATDEDFTNVVNENNNEEEKDVSLQQAIDEVNNEIDARPIKIVNSEADLQEYIDAGVDPDIIDAIREDLNDPNVMGRYEERLMGVVLLFADKMKAAGLTKDHMKGVIYHENVHSLAQRGFSPEDFAETASLIEKIQPDLVEWVREIGAEDNLSEEAINEEVVAYYVEGIGDKILFLNQELDFGNDALNARMDQVAELLTNNKYGTGKKNEEVPTSPAGGIQKDVSVDETTEEVPESDESGEVDDYLQPRDAEEENIIADVNDKLQKEIDAAIKERDKAASDLQKAKAKESERATDLFADDNAFNQEGQLFDNSDMPTDRTQEGVNRRTQAETDALAAANQKLNQLQSPEERNSRIRGALDNHRRQTSFTAETESNEQYLASHPLTEEQIMADTEATEDEKLNAIDFLKGEDDSAISRFYYDGIYERAQKTSSFENRQKKEEKTPAKEKKEEKPIETSDPMKAIEQAAEDFKKGWRYSFHYDKDTKHVSITREQVGASGIPIGDGRWHLEANSLEEMRGILENPKNNLGGVFLAVEARLHNAEMGEKLRKEQETVEKRKERWQGKREEQKSQDQTDIDSALKEFNDFLDNAKGSNILDKFMRKGIEGNDKLQANLLDAFTLTNDAQRMFLKDLLRLASKVGYAYIKSGIHDAQAWSKQMSESIGQKLREVLGWDDAIVGEFVDEVWNQKYTVDGQRMRLSEHAERLKNEKPADQTVNVNKQKNNEPENNVSLQGDSEEFADRQEKIKRLSLFVHDILRHATIQGVDATYDYDGIGHVSIKTISGVKSLAEKLGLENMSLTDLQELVEAQIVQLAREFSETKSLSDEQKFANIVRLYKIQPTLSARDNDRINKQQYSTPAPMAYLMGRFVNPKGEAKSGLEPSAGNGMLTVALPKGIMHVNDIDEMRLSNLAKQGFKEVTNQDGLKSFGEKQYDVVVTNPPFGSTAPKVYNGLYEISGLEHQMAINALESMKDDGKAAIIIGGNTEYNQNGTIKGKDRAFLNYLYAQYNVVDVINMNGHDLYSKQGTGFPVRMILINGRKEFDPKSFAPVIQKARAERVNSYDELYKRVNDDILSDTNKPASVHNTESGESGRVDDNSNAGTSTQTGVRNVRTEGSSRQSERRSDNGSGVQRSNSTTRKGIDSEVRPELGGGLFDVGSRSETSEPSGSTSQPAGGQRTESGETDTQRPVAGTDNSVGVGQRGAGTPQQNEQPAVKRGLGTEKVPYRKQSGNPFTLQSLMPAEQADVVKKALEDLGDVDQFLVNELGYSNKEELHRALAAEQIDSVAMAISQMNQGSAFIIGDQTGIGKGRQAAALIRYGVKKGGCPVFITVKKALFSDMYRDLCDIGSPKLRPFIWSADDTEHSGNVTDKDGNVIYQLPNAKEQKRVIDYINKHGKLPKEYDYVLTTYDSFKSGTMDYEEGKKKERKFPKGKKPSAVHFNGQAKRDALESLAQNSYVIMDESHNAGGEGSNVSNYLQYITTQAKGLTFLSATFAKRPGNMPIYSLKTAISKAGVKVGELIDAVKRGGATFQEIMSKALTEAGQMIRRERDMTGVTIDWKGIEDEDVIQKQREQYDTVIGLFNEIIDFQRTYVDPIVNNMNDEEAENQGEVEHTPGTRDMGINNTPFASRTYNMVQQVLLSLKAEEAAKRAIEHLKLGRKPVITVANTNEGAADEATGLSDEAMEMPDLSVNLKKGLQGTMRITKKDAFGNSVNEMIPFDKLSQEGQERYREIMDAIDNASSGLSLSPIDVIKNELKKAGYKVGELTGRKAEFVYNEDGTVRRVKRQDTDKKRIAADFNNGNLDALILNRSAGTGISLHASSTFKDQRQRIMIVAQAQGDVNDEVQIRGRIDRTGQVLRGMYEYVVSQIPSEQRLLMMLKAKLRSLDANTTSSQKSKFNEMDVQDIINKYGDQIVVQYLAEHPDLYTKMADPFKWGEGVYVTPVESLVSEASRPQGDGATASKVLGRMALLKVAEQEKMLAELGDLYQAEIDRLNEMGENDLEITEMPLKAKTLSKDIWEEGVEPGGKNPFADNSYVETVEMDVLKKPMKGEEVKKTQARLLDGKTWDEYKQETLDRVDSWAAEKEEETRNTFKERAEKKASAEKEKYIKGAKRMQDKNGMTDEEIERNGQSQYDTIFKEETGEKLNNALDSIKKQKQVFVDALETFNTDGVYALPTDIYDLSQITFEPSFGKVIDIKITDNYSANASTITFATLDGRRKITIPINGMVKQNNGEKKDIKPVIVQQTAQTRSGFFGRNIADMQRVLEQNIDNWDKLTSTATRKKGHIITGNLLKALTELRKQGKGGKLISYTTDTGDVRQGILMSDQFDPKSLTSKNPISSAKDDLWEWSKDRKITSADKEVVVRNDGGGWFKLLVPKSKKKGDIYFNDETLLNLVSGQFEGSTKMAADFRQDNLDAILKRLDELGVTVESTKEEQESKETGRRYDEDIEPSYMDAVANEEQFDNTSYAEIRRAEAAVRRYGKKTKKDEVRFVFTGDYFYLYTQKEYGDIKLQAQIDIENNRELIDTLIKNYSPESNEKEGQSTIRSASDIASAIEGRRSSSDGRNRDNADAEGGRRYDVADGDLDLRQQAERHGNNAVVRKVPKRRKRLQDRIAKHIEQLLDKLGTKARTTVYHSLDELPEADRKYIENAEKHGRKVRGWYENGHIYLYLPHIDSEYQAEKTIWHETVAHHGLRELIGAENYNKLLKQLWLEHKDGDMGKWVTERMQRNGWRLNEAIDEYLAREAEKEPFKDPSLWQQLKWWLSEILHDMGFNTEPTLTDVKYLFWVSQNQLREGDALRQIKQQAFLYNLESKTPNTPYVNMYAARPEDIDNPDAEGAYDDGTRYSEETDEEVIERLEKEPKVKAYRAMSLIDGKLYPPMATKQDGSLVNPIELGKWEKSDEHPEKAVLRNGKWVFKLTKDNGKSLFAAYNPYIHTSTTMLNDQFSEAQNRPNLVVVEVEVPESELTSGYKAEKAKDAVGKLEWKAGVIQGQLTGTREVILSRWDKPVRIVPTEEVAESIANQIKGKVEVMPSNVVTPQQRAELEKLGVKFVETDNRGFIKDGENKGKSYSSVYGKKSERRYDEDPMDYSAKKVYNERLNRVETVFSEAYQDAMVSLKTAQNAIVGDKEIPDSQNAYMAENLMHGKNKNEMDLFNAMFRDPLIKTINKIMNLTGMNWGDVDRYVYSKSGLERNREFFVRDWLNEECGKTIKKYEDLNPMEQDIYDAMAARIEEDFDDGIIATEEEKNKKLDKALQNAHNEYLDDIEREYRQIKSNSYQDLLNGDINFVDYIIRVDRFIENNIDDSYDPSEHDYSGFRAMYGDENGKYDEDVILAEVMTTEGQIEDDNVTELWKRINNATQYGLERYREAGMRSDDTIDRVESMFHWYVPMRGFKDDMGEDMYQYFTAKGKEKSYIGGLLKHAKGRGSEANFPISTIFAMTYKAISDCNQNLVNQKLYRLCQANPNDLILLSDSWAVLDETTGEWKEVGPNITEDMDEEEVRQATLAWEEQMNQLAQDGKAKKITGKAKFDYVPMDKKKKSEHEVDVRINGQPKKMIVTSNPRMAQALNGQLKFERGKNIFSKWNASIKNMMASLFTSYSPTFALRNMFRDWTHFRTMLGVREGHGYASQANKYYRQSLFKMVGLFKKYREGTLDENKEIERDFKEFMDNGGITGFVQMQKVDDIQKQMEKLYEQQKAGKPIKFNNKIWDYTLGAIEALNEGIENNARFATYRASRHYSGRTKARSAYDAKEITVNFNRKGAGSKSYGFKSQNKRVEDAAKAFGVTSQIFGEGRIFFNATVQAIATTFKNFQNADGSLNKPYIAKWAAKYALPPFMFGLLLPYINQALAAVFDGGDGDDDPYANLAEWTRRKNLCIYIGNNNFITIPIGQELAAFLALGDIVAANTYAPNIKPVDRDITDEMVDVMNTFSPVDINTKITKGGLMEDPVDEVVGRTFSTLAPLVAVGQNLGWTGRPIYREDRFPNDQYTPEYQMVYSSTNPVLVNAMKQLHELGGGDDIVRGKFEVNPAIIQYLWEQYTGGPGKVLSNTISIGKDAKDIFVEGEAPDFNIRKVEGLKAFVQQGDDRTAYYRAQAKYRKYLEDAKQLKDAVNGYKKAAATDPLAPAKLEKISASEDYVRMSMILNADKELRKLNKAANQAEGKQKKELRKLYNEHVAEVVKRLDEVGKD